MATLVNQTIHFDPTFTTRAECLHEVGGRGCGLKVEITEKEARVHSKAWVSMHTPHPEALKDAKCLEDAAAVLLARAKDLRCAK